MKTPILKLPRRETAKTQAFYINKPLLAFARSTYDPTKPDDVDPLMPDIMNQPIECRETLTHDGEHGFFLLGRPTGLIGVAVTTETRAWVWFLDQVWYAAAYAAGCEPITAGDWETWAGAMIRQAISNPNTKDSRKPLLQQIIQAYETL